MYMVARSQLQGAGTNTAESGGPRAFLLTSPLSFGFHICFSFITIQFLSVSNVASLIFFRMFVPPVLLLLLLLATSPVEPGGRPGGRRPAPPPGLAAFRQAQQSEKRGRLQEAVHHYQAAVKADPKWTPALFHLADLLGRAGSDDQSFRIMREVVRIGQRDVVPAQRQGGSGGGRRPKRSPRIQRQLLDLHIVATLRAGQGYVKRDDLDAAERLFQHVSALDPTNEDALMGLAGVFFKREAWEENIRTLKAIVALNPNRTKGDVWSNLGLVYEKLHGPDNDTAAVAAYARGASLGDSASALALGKVHLRAGRFEEALTATERARALDPTNPDPDNDLGNLLNEVGRHKDATDAYERSLAARVRLAALSVAKWVVEGPEKAGGGGGGGGAGEGGAGENEDLGAKDCTAWYVEHRWSGRARRINISNDTAVKDAESQAVVDIDRDVQCVGGCSSGRVFRAGSDDDLPLGALTAVALPQHDDGAEIVANVSAFPLQFPEKQAVIVSLRNVRIAGTGAIVYSVRRRSRSSSRAPGKKDGPEGHGATAAATIACTLHTGQHGVMASFRGEDSPFDQQVVRSAGRRHHYYDRPVASAVTGYLLNYYHWTAEALPRLVLLLQHVPADTLLLVQHSQWAEETLAVLGVPMGRVMFHYRKHRPHLAFRRLYMADWLGPASSMTTSGSSRLAGGDEGSLLPPYWVFLPGYRAVQAARGAVMQGLELTRYRDLWQKQLEEGEEDDDDNDDEIAKDGDADGGHLAIFISRRDSSFSARAILGEERLVAVLERTLLAQQSAGGGATNVSARIFIGKGLTLRQQIALFQRARLVIGLHGAGLVNSLWCRPGQADVVELPLSNYETYSYFGHLAAVHGLRYWVVPELETNYWANLTVTSEGEAGLARVLGAITRRWGNE